VSTLAGSRKAGFADGASGDARFSNPGGLAIDAEGNVLVADEGNHCIRKIAPDGTVSTLAGSPEQEAGFADGASGDARFRYPSGLAIDEQGNVIVADFGNNCVRKVTGCGLGRGTTVLRWPVGTGSVTSDLLSMLEDAEFADATFEVEGTRISAHRVILVARSAYFRAMFTSNCREAKPDAIILVGETTALAFRRLLGYLYSDTLQLDDEVVIDVMRKAREYDMTRAYNMCMRYCLRHTCSSNAIPRLLHADAVQLDELREAMLQYLRRNFRVVRAEAPETLAALSQANPGLMLAVMNVI
jgi:hypothetical protein